VPAPNSGGGFALRQVTVTYPGTTALDAVSLVVPAADVLAIVGPSGAGKTTLLRLLNRAVVPAGGQVLYQDDNLTDLTPTALRALRRRVGFVHQDLRLVPNLRVVRNVLSGALGRLGFWRSARLFLRPSADELAEVHRLLEQVGIADQMFQRVDRLSGGQRQRVAIARALYQKPAWLVADEPVASVDPARAADLLELLTRVGHAQGVGLMVSLHDPVLAQRFFPRLVGLRAGRIVFDEPAARVTAEQLSALYELEAGREF